jgi:hypothetical protein
MARHTTSVIIFLALLLSAACGGEPAQSGSRPDDLVLTLLEQHGSGESGKATLTPLGEQTKIVLELRDRSASPVAQPQPAHIHRGSCAKLDPRPAYGLADVKEGASTSTVAVPLSKLRSGGFAINVHESAAEIETYVACGNLADARPRIVDPIGHDRIEE